ncbi:MAG TPA: TonB-dependent receptor plug domain-containing protein, partial [Cytophagales bacterium]|nr:TonB-dependent receptor plug domain-containing protein [Cytophagales bacterium]
MKYLIPALFVLHAGMAQTQFTLSGYVKELGSGENVIGAIVYAPKYELASETNSYGFYSLTLPKDDSVKIVFAGDSYQEKDTIIDLDKNVLLNYELKSIDVTELETVVMTETERKISKEVLMSKIDVPINQIKSIPALLGEKDVLKVIQLLPGVKRGSEGSMGFYVRGGGPDQNLIILDDAVVYNAQHLFGFFSVFNGDAIRNIELTKGGFPARYGGRLSSVLDMRMKDGHKEKFQGEAGIGILSSRLTLEGPIKKGKSSFLVSGRRTYFDLLTKPFQPKAT